MIIQLNRLREFLSRLLVLLQLEVSAPQCIVGRYIVRIQSDRLLQSFHGALQVILGHSLQGVGVSILGAAGSLQVKFRNRRFRVGVDLIAAPVIERAHRIEVHVLAAAEKGVEVSLEPLRLHGLGRRIAGEEEQDKSFAPYEVSRHSSSQRQGENASQNRGFNCRLKGPVAVREFRGRSWEEL